MRIEVDIISFRMFYLRNYHSVSTAIDLNLLLASYLLEALIRFILVKYAAYAMR